MERDEEGDAANEDAQHLAKKNGAAADRGGKSAAAHGGAEHITDAVIPEKAVKPAGDE